MASQGCDYVQSHLYIDEAGTSGVASFSAVEWKAMEQVRVVKGSLITNSLSRFDLFPFRNLERLYRLVCCLLTWVAVTFDCFCTLC
jgi:hypothetical protein